MSAKDLVKQLVSAAKAEKMELTEVASLVVDAWTSVITPPVDTEYDANGVSAPDDLGLVKLKGLEELRAKYQAAGQQGAADAIRHRFACTPGYLKCDPGSAGQAIEVVSISTASFYAGLGMPFGWSVHPVMANPNPLGPKWLPDRNHVVADAYAIPQEYTTADACVKYIADIAAKFVV